MTNTLFSPAQLHKAKALGNLGFTNPFGEERIALEKQILGTDYTPAFHVWVITPTHQGFSPNLAKLAQAAEELLAIGQHRLKQRYQPTDEEWQIYGE
ncbi:MAG TPA: hypothetical protein PK944_08115, partial [Agitococcus sp.]|nr:hypothetical protein [Agitococcus sp.]